MSLLQPEAVRRSLAEVARERKANAVEDKALARRVRVLIAEARRVEIPMSEVARILEMDRTSLYRTYIK
jgi:DNA-binding phage protein